MGRRCQRVDRTGLSRVTVRGARRRGKTKEAVGRQPQRVYRQDWTFQSLTEGSRRQAEVEAAGCEVIGGALQTLRVNGQTRQLSRPMVGQEEAFYLCIAEASFIQQKSTTILFDNDGDVGNDDGNDDGDDDDDGDDGDDDGNYDEDFEAIL